jgi:hypothetical protein
MSSIGTGPSTEDTSPSESAAARREEKVRAIARAVAEKLEHCAMHGKTISPAEARKMAEKLRADLHETWSE